MIKTLVDIPIIDFEPFLSGNTEAQQAVARQIYHACHEIGFMYLNPGIPATLINNLFAQTKLFFELPLDVKNKLAWVDKFSNRGYVGVERERLNPDKPGDLKEAFNVGKELNLEEILKQDKSSSIMNQWPVGEDKFRQTVLEFYQACAEAADKICQAFAIALELPESFFADKHEEQNYTLRLLHYPPLEQVVKPGQVRAGEHSDYGSFTLLFQDEVGGLEVRTADGEWIAAPYIPDTVVVNTGDLMQQWTNHEFCSTKHRVMIPSDDRVKRSRYSVAFFCHPNNDAKIACIESCQGENRPPLYPPISAGDYLLSRLQATY